LSQEQKQTIAREFNYSETTFLHEKESEDGPDEWTVDIFMTTSELPFAGHPTIGTACHVLAKVAQSRNAKGGKIEAAFKVKAGPIGLQYDVEKGLARAAIPHNV
jgi:PhzF family phenazine biosynthesis protein